MVKKIAHDIIPRRKAQLIESLQHRKLPEVDISPSPRKKSSRLWWWLGGILFLVLCAGATIYLTALFSYATVRIVPHSEVLVIEETVQASTEALTGTLLMKSMKLSDAESDVIIGTSTQSVLEKASGEVVLYNKQDLKPQHLIARTRLETPEGKIFRIESDVTIPEAKMVAGKLVAGRVVVIVKAALPGEEYNLGLRDFTLPALKGSPRYGNIYGRSQTPLAGGYKGSSLVASKEALAASDASLAARVQKKLITSALAQVPQDYILYPRAISVTLAPLESSTTPKSSRIQLSKRGTLEAYLFKKADLLQFIAKKKLPNYKNEPITSPALDKLDVLFTPREGLHDQAVATITLRIKGTVPIVYTFDTESFRQSLAGLSRKKYLEMLSRFAAIDKATINFTPSWATSFPSRAERIHVEQVSP